MTKVTKEAALAGVPYLAVLPAAERAALAGQVVVKTVGKRETVFEAGAPAAGLWIVVEGRISLVRVSRRGREQVLHTEGPGATLAEVPVFDGSGYVATAVAAEPSRLLFVPRAVILDCCRRHPDVSLGVIAVLARRVRAFAALIEDLALHDVTARLAHFLLAEARRAGGNQVELPGTRDDVAARLGTVRELVSRALSRLRARRIAEVRGRRVRIVDRKALAALAERPID